MIRNRTIYMLSWGHTGRPGPTRYFGPCNLTDAAVRFAQKVTALDQDPEISAAYVHLSRLPDSIYPDGFSLVGWTKTSDERPTLPGFLTEDEAR